MDFSSVKSGELEELLRGWKISSNGNTIFDGRNNSYNIRGFEINENYVEVVLEDGNLGFVFEDTPYVWKGSPKNGVIESFNGKFAIYYGGNVSEVYDKILNLKIEDGKIYSKVRENKKEKIIIGNENGFVESEKYDQITFRIKDGKIYGEAGENLKRKIIIGDEKGFVESKGYDKTKSLIFNDEKFYGEIKEDGKELFVIFDKELNELTRSKRYNWVDSWEIENGVIYGKAGENEKEKVVIGSGNRFIESKEYESINNLKVDNDRIYSSVKEDGKWKFVAFDKELNKLNEGSEYNEICKWKVENDKIYGEIRDEDRKKRIVILDKKLNELYRSDSYINILYWEIKDGKVHVTIKKNKKWENIILNENN